VIIQHELAATIEIATEAAELVLSYAESGQLDVRAKGVGDVVTAADTASEALIMRRLGETFSDDGVVGEEGARVRGTSGRQWYVDPLDGTLNFSRNLPIWCVSMALYEGDRPLLAVIRDPVSRETFSAGRGIGSYRNGQPISCSDVETASDSVVHITVDLKDLGESAGLDDIVVIAPRVLRTRNIGSAALALAYVAAGRFDAMLHRFAYSWDYGAGVLLVEEAGGIVTDMQGRAYTPRTHDMCASANGSLHTEYLSMLAESERSRAS
jgi:myo-inositol-1(or 4)-monophosphatase